MNYPSRLILGKILFPFAFLGFILMTTSCSKTSTVINPQNTKSFSGEEIFNAVFFHEGDALNQLTSLNDKSVFGIHNELPRIIKEKKNIMEDIISNIKKIDPLYFGKFLNVIKSRDYNLIENELKAAGNIILEAGLISDKYGIYFKKSIQVTRNVDISKYNLQTEAGKKAFQEAATKEASKVADNSEQCVALAVFVVVAAVIWESAAVVNIVAAVTAVAATIAVAVVAGAVKVVPKTVAQSAGSFQNEKLIYQLANNF